MWKPRRISLCLVTLTATALTLHPAGANQVNYDAYPSNLTAAIHGLIRSSRAISTFGVLVADYKYSLHGLQEDSDDYANKLSEVHLRAAKRILKLCEANKGFYVKAGQFVAAMRKVPHQYSSTLSSLQDQAPPCHFKAIKKMLMKNFGQDLSDIFLSFDERPVAAASIAQVHHGVLKDHQQVAVKVQYPGLESLLKIDLMTMSFVSKSISWVDDVESLKEMGVNPIKVAEALMEVFAEMIFVHGFVHGDPHPGNILVSQTGPKGFSLVLLDHGIYKQLDEGFRKDYCELWEAMVLKDSNRIRKLGERFGVGKYFRYLPVIFIGRNIDSKSAIGREMSNDDKQKLKLELKSLQVEDISSFMESLPSDLLTILRADGLLRSVTRKLGAPQRVRLSTYVKYAIHGLSKKLDLETDSVLKVAIFKLNANLRYLQVQLTLEVLQLLSWIEKFKQFFRTLCKRLFVL